MSLIKVLRKTRNKELNKPRAMKLKSLSEKKMKLRTIKLNKFRTNKMKPQIIKLNKTRKKQESASDEVDINAPHLKASFKAYTKNIPTP